MTSPSALTWVDWPAPRMPGRAALSAALIGCASVAAAAVEPFAGLICAGLLLANTSEALFPSTFVVDDEGVRVDRFLHHRRVAWAEIAGWRARPDGVLLLGRGRTGGRVRRRTVFLGKPVEPEALEARLRSQLGEPQAAAQPSAAA